MDNITMGNQQISAGDIMILSERLGFKNFLEEMEQGFDTIIDPVGKRLSRNLIQKILLLRALINHPRLLLLEEPWTNLEEEHKLEIQNYIMSHCPGTTVLVVTGDENFSRICDQMLYLSNGSILSTPD